jgi:aspartate racemase
MLVAQSRSEDDRRFEAYEQARTLLWPDENELPAGVIGTIDFFVSVDAWFKLSRNSKALSCRDAASRRWRLGYEGIELADELRSYLAKTNRFGQATYVLFHCRGNSHFDFSKASECPEIKGCSFSKADVREFADEELGYGLINPFVAPKILARSCEPVIQIFDRMVTETLGEAGTMMTNAGDYTWAVEFQPKEIVGSLGSVHPIAFGDEQEKPNAVIGILTGNSPESGALLWKKINRQYLKSLGGAFRGDLSYPKVIIHSQPAMGWSMELAERDHLLRGVFRNEIVQLATGGASVIGVACNTTQYYVENIRRDFQASGTAIVSLAQSIREWIGSRRDENFFLAGIGYVTRDDGWSAFEDVISLPNVFLPDNAQARIINELAYDVKQGKPEALLYQKFRRVVSSVKQSNVLLLLTELSLIFDRFPRVKVRGHVIYDALDIYAASILSARSGISL